jgi:hypothetical protein
MHRIVCFLSGGHRWQDLADTSGSMTFCARCGAQRHTRNASADTREARSHPNLGPSHFPRPSHDPEDVRRRTVNRMDEDEQRKLAELENARAEDDDTGDEADEPPTSPQVGGPGLTGLTPPD